MPSSSVAPIFLNIGAPCVLGLLVGPGNLRVDYVLPRKTLQLVDSGIFWPVRSDPLSRLTGVFDPVAWGLVGGLPTSDHRSVWIDVTVPSAK